MDLSLRVFSLAVLLTCPLVLGGCGSSTTVKPSPTAAPATDPHDVPITEADVKMPANYADAIARIKQYRDAIRDGAGSPNPAVAHRPLDELDIVLSKLPGIARDSGVPQEHWETVNVASRELRTLFNQVHAAIDDKKTPDYNAVAKPIEDAIGRLESVANQPDK